MEFVKSMVLQMDLQAQLTNIKAVRMEFILEINTEVSPCATSHSVGLNLCVIFLLFFLARVLSYSAADIPSIPSPAVLKPVEELNSPCC